MAKVTDSRGAFAPTGLPPLMLEAMLQLKPFTVCANTHLPPVSNRMASSRPSKGNGAQMLRAVAPVSLSGRTCQWAHLECSVSFLRPGSFLSLGNWRSGRSMAFALSLQPQHRAHLTACCPSRCLVFMSPTGFAASLLAGAGTRILVQNELPEPDLGMGDSLADSLGSALTAMWQEASLGWARPPEGASAGRRAPVRPQIHA